MKTFTLPHNEDGFAAITVMVISFLGGLVVFDTMQENINQERMAGNYSKELHAHIQAENGMAKAYNTLVANGTTSDEVLNNLKSAKSVYAYTINASSSSAASTDPRIITTTGQYYDGKFDMRGEMEPGASGFIQPFNNAITACDGVALAGAGLIDSYNGEYDANNPGNEGDVTILNSDASGLTLNGGTQINGDVSINGDLNVVSGAILGDADVSGSLTVINTGDAAGRDGVIIGTGVDGDIRATGDVTYNYTGALTVADSISSNGSVKVSVGTDSNFHGEVKYSNEYESVNDADKNNGTKLATGHVGNVGTQECDILDIASEFANTTDGIGKLANTTPTNVKFGYPLSEYVINDTGLTAFDETDNVKNWIDIDTQQETVDFLGEQTNVHVLDIDNFGDASLTLTVESGSNITIYLSGNSTTNISGKIIVEDGASLNIITNDKINIGSNGLITNVIDTNGDGVYETETTAAVNSNDDISTTIYSGYESQNSQDNGITAAGGSASSFSAYAPNATIQLSGGGDLYGALRSNYLNVSGGAGIHFDENLGDIDLGGDDTTTTLAINRWF